MGLAALRDIAYKSLLELSTDEGIYASSKEEVYGCIFGRDTAITTLKILHSLESNQPDGLIDNKKLKEIVRNALIKIIALQGKAINKESGEQPGKFIHEYRKDKYERLINRPMPWYIYDDGILRNYDSIDSTPLTLIALYNYWKITHDEEFLLTVLPAVEKGLVWIKNYADLDGDDLLEYELPKQRKHGGLSVQSWTDSESSLRQVDGKLPLYPIAPVEVQGYAWLALKLWSNFYKNNPLYGSSKNFLNELLQKAKALKKVFNNSFVFKDKDGFFFAQALDGKKRQVKTITANPLLLLWATFQEEGAKEAIVEEKYIPYLVKRVFAPDLFDHEAGIRTMSTNSPTFNPNTNSYHNGSFWPKLNGMIHEGLEIWGYNAKASRLKDASLKPIMYFGTPIELYIKDDSGYLPYKSEQGKEGCKIQAWSAAVVLDLLK